MQAGWDWAQETHDVTVTDERGRRVAHWTLRHVEDELDLTMRRLAQLATPVELPVAIETRSGLVVDRLLAAGHRVVPVHPNAFHALRPRWGAARAKSDAGDSYKLAEFLRTNLDADESTLRVLAPTRPETVHLRELCRGRGSQFTARLIAADQLRALLRHHWPGAAELFDRVDSPIALAFLARYPTAASAQRVTPAVMERFLKRHGYSGKKPPAELVARLRRAPRPASPLPDDLLTAIVSAHIAQLNTSLQLLGQLEHLIGTRAAAHPYAHLFATMPRIGTLNLAQIVAEVGPILERADNAEQVAAEAGVAPVTYASGHKRSVVFRVSANRHARQALTVFADNSRHADPWAARIYAGARARGHRHPHAIRILARGWVRTIWQCWHAQTPYDPHRHLAA
jgi:transposase